MKTEREALAASLEMEKEGYDFYLKTAEKSIDKMTKDVFSFLAAEELKHIESIKKFYEAEVSGEKVDFERMIGDIDIKQAHEAIAKLFEGLDEKAPTDKKDLDAYKFARDFELNGEKFYRKAAEESSDENVKRLFEFLVEEERRHFKMIDDSLSYLENPEEWFHRLEGWHTEG